MTLKELQFGLVQLPPWAPDVCGAAESLVGSVSKSEPSPSAAFFALLLFFFEDILIARSVST